MKTAILAGLLSLLFASAPARAGNEAPNGAEIRLLTGPIQGAAAQMGLEIALLPGWKTYWRSPGDAGIPPTIETGGSQNIAGVEIGFPAPERFGEGLGQSVGYTAPVVLPLAVRLADPGRPARLVAKVMIGVCRDICLPVEVEVEARIDPKARPAPGQVAAIEEAVRQVPVRVEGTAPLAVASVAREAAPKTGNGPETLVVTVVSDRPEEQQDLFAEGPDGWALPLPVRLDREGGRTRWRVALEGLPPGASPKGAALRFTVVTPDRAVEQAWRLD
ncbi:protein-disulfide reductase DsbD domain-containing protein [Prosthecomicrobium hirschii]|uniref:protein-disulfide reductase DsbD domain-containing protein n=1 Tax=Prosthecodimorpha hirschii TaxID=665126 RepID=UPI00221EEF5D|nr:protein-disulfide reductase DsbD domain-containing protein [Prosthecomicrobium hirschii]MCW1840933.1 protein-disulfide reductase DsbD family protein [Prosthecomicrobium hirschii]